MSRFHSYLDTAAKLLEQYKGGEPFPSLLKKYFSANKKHGSRDRKQISQLCYAYFRTAKVLPSAPVTEQLTMALYLCSVKEEPLLESLRPEWNERTTLSLAEKLRLIGSSRADTDLFPWPAELSAGVDLSAFNHSFVVQPDTFIRIRPGYETAVRKKLEQAAVSFTEVKNDCLAIPAATRLDDLYHANREALVQDYSSQQVGEMLELVKQKRGTGHLRVWDCCAASGGKSIMAKDRLGKIELTVSDIRESILHNLKKRFAEAGMGAYEQYCADLSIADPLPPGEMFELVIADVPCSGSGTWGRTPEQLYYFQTEKIAEFSQLQQKIVARVLPHVKPGGNFLYITCSVFKKENETVAAFITDNGFDCLHQGIIPGYDKKADSMFAALFQRTL